MRIIAVWHPPYDGVPRLPKSPKNLYLIPVLSKALDILELMQADNAAMSLESIYKQTGTSKTTVYRILKTFVHRGYLAQGQDGTYRHVSRPKKLRFGFGSQSADMPFSNEVSRSIRAAAAAVSADLLVLDNEYDAAKAVANAEEFIQNRVDLIIEFNTEHQVAPAIGDRAAAAKIPMIAIDIPHPNSTYFGVDNYRVGVEAGEVLAEHALEEWGGKVNWVLGLDLPEAGLLVQGRVSGAFEAVRSAMPSLPIECYVRMDGRGMRDRSHTLVAEFLDRHPEAKRILIAAATDTSALGAVDAAREKKRHRHVAIVGQDCIAEAIAEMKKATSPLIASVSHETSTYGPSIMRLALAILKGQTVAPYNYVVHRLVRKKALLAAAS